MGMRMTLTLGACWWTVRKPSLPSRDICFPSASHPRNPWHHHHLHPHHAFTGQPEGVLLGRETSFVQGMFRVGKVAFQLIKTVIQ